MSAAGSGGASESRSHCQRDGSGPDGRHRRSRVRRGFRRGRAREQRVRPPAVRRIVGCRSRSHRAANDHPTVPPVARPRLWIDGMRGTAGLGCRRVGGRSPECRLGRIGCRFAGRAHVGPRVPWFSHRAAALPSFSGSRSLRHPPAGRWQSPASASPCSTGFAGTAAASGLGRFADTMVDLELTGHDRPPGISPHRATSGPSRRTALTKRFGDNMAVNDVELLVPRGCAFGYLGPNGAGKTTLIRVLLGLTHADAGTMSLLGHSVPRHRDAALARVGAIVDEPRFHGHLTGRQNLQILAAAREPAAKGPHRPCTRARRHPASGRRQGVEVLHGHAPAARRCRLPTRGSSTADPRRANERTGPRRHARHARHDQVAGCRRSDRVLSSHLLDEVERTCDAVAIVDRGTVIRQGPISQLLAGSSFEVQVECSDPGVGRQPARGDGVRRARAGRARWTGDLPTGGHRARCDRRNQPPAGRGWHLGVPAPAHPGLAGAVVPVRDQPIGSEE
jgi:ABC-type Na+ transport system ATPase subunit NatA